MTQADPTSGKRESLDDDRHVVRVGEPAVRAPLVTRGRPGTITTRVFQRRPSEAMHHQRSACAATTRTSIGTASAAIDRAVRPMDLHQGTDEQADVQDDHEG